MNVETETTASDSPAESGFPWHCLVYAGPANVILSVLTIVAVGLYLTTNIQLLATIGGLGLVILIFGGFLTVILVEIGLFFDIPAVRAAAVQWSPSRTPYMLGALPFAPLVGMVYVLQRRRYLR
jgi:hypothetical protein